jgi:hypothetical protein
VTQCERILRHLQDYGSITQAEAVTEYGCYRLGARIWDLKAQGVPIRSERVTGKKPVRRAGILFQIFHRKNGTRGLTHG